MALRWPRRRRIRFGLSKPSTSSNLVPSGEAEERGEDDNDGRAPEGEDGEVGSLPPLEAVESAPSGEEPRREPRGPGQVHEQDEVEAERRRAVRGEPEIAD